MKEPILPIIILPIINNLPTAERDGVMDVLIPREVNELIASKKISMNVNPCSVIRRQNVVNSTHPKPTLTIAMDRYTCERRMLLPWRETAVFPDIAAFTDAKKTAKVVIFIPLPVDPGAEPTKEMNMISMMVAIWKEPALVRIKPVLRNETT